MSSRRLAVDQFVRTSLRAVGVAALLAAGAAQATIISGSVGSGGGAVFTKLTVPLSNTVNPPNCAATNSVGDDCFQSINLYGFDESQNTTLTSAIAAGTGVVLSGGGLASGLTVASHYVFFDPVNGRLVGTVQFDSVVLAILTSTTTLLNTDYLANTGVNYLNPGLRGLEQGDVVTISGTHEISVDFSASTPGDYIRVLTAYSPGAVPEPGSLALVGLALAGLGMSGLGLAARRRQA